MTRRRERRKAPRVEWNTPARIRLHGVSGTLPCVVNNLSNSGARLTALNIKTLPDEFTLELSRDGARVRDCRVMWRTKSELGVNFVALAPDLSKPRPKRSQMALATA